MGLGKDRLRLVAETYTSPTLEPSREAGSCPTPPVAPAEFPQPTRTVWPSQELLPPHAPLWHQVGTEPRG